MSRLVVLGGGIAGLTAAFRRPEASGETVILEAAPEVGGSIRTIRQEERVLEAGPNTLRTNEAAERLIVELDLAHELVVADPKAPRYIVRGGARRPLVPGPGALFTSILSAGDKLRVLGEPFVRRRPDSLADESVASFFRRRFGEGIARWAVGPIVSGVYAGDPESLSVRSAFPKLWEAEGRAGSVIKGLLSGKREGPKGPRVKSRTVTFTRGLAALPEALTGRLRARGALVETGCEVIAVEGPLDKAAHGSRWRIATASGRKFVGDRLLVTLPSRAVARLLGDRLPRSKAALESIPYAPVAVVMTSYAPEREDDFPKGFGALIPRGEGFKSLGILYPSSLFPPRAVKGRALLTAFLGGATDPTLVDKSEDELVAIADDEIRRLHPRIGPRFYAYVVKWAAAIPQPPLGHHATLAALDEDLRALNESAGDASALVVTGPWRDGISLSDRIARGAAIGPSL